MLTDYRGMTTFAALHTGRRLQLARVEQPVRLR